MRKEALGDRMKRYEATTRLNVLPRTPTILRLDGKAFHTFTKVNKCERPYCEKLHTAMINTADFLVTQIQGAVLAYVQSDEISILLRDWDTFTTDSWYNGKIQKMVSVSASMATLEFNRQFQSNGALFDSRAFNLPFAEVTNYFVWRQQDATRNSIQMLAQYYFSHKQLHGKNCSQLQDMLMLEHGVNWNDIDTWKKRGATVLSCGKLGIEHNESTIIDDQCPIFTANRNYIDRALLL